ncbi:hypothetical protein PR202_gb00775 [Eleusine coracana subsp. coracana]|uniref:Uncharacterized protein n=1 Tax=Eleusine coracana subsp. coracana TaxID=191504 RepID=A0AAV5DTE8_ELECO|nr:hypothetical protein PR202_gb00775 [Eleusine coracana subsp. coracana]
MRSSPSPLTVPELALLRIEVQEYDMSEKHDFGGQTCLPVWELKQGIRAVPLHDRKGNKYKSVRLLIALPVCVSFEKQQALSTEKKKAGHREQLWRLQQGADTIGIASARLPPPPPRRRHQLPPARSLRSSPDASASSNGSGSSASRRISSTSCSALHFDAFFPNLQSWKEGACMQKAPNWVSPSRVGINFQLSQEGTTEGQISMASFPVWDSQKVGARLRPHHGCLPYTTDQQHWVSDHEDKKWNCPGTMAVEHHSSHRD